MVYMYNMLIITCCLYVIKLTNVFCNNNHNEHGQCYLCRYLSFLLRNPDSYQIYCDMGAPEN